MSKSKLATRTITGLLYGMSLIGSLLLSQHTFYLFFFIVMILGLKEFYQLVEHKSVKPQKLIGFIISIEVFLSTYFYFLDQTIFQLLLGLILFSVFIVFTIELFRDKTISFNNIGATLMSVIYVAIPLSLLSFLAHNETNEYHYQMILSIFILVWLSDMGGYFAGVNFGKHKLLERVSPKKSWEGVVGGLILCLIGSYVLSLYFPIMSKAQWLILGAIVCVSSVIGDLIESMLKRSANIKDSGNILPGHGGILDRFDSVLFVIPIVYIFKLFIL
jgi:phosphatidate cytidylyltransferase